MSLLSIVIVRTVRQEGRTGSRGRVRIEGYRLISTRICDSTRVIPTRGNSGYRL